MAGKERPKVKVNAQARHARIQRKAKANGKLVKSNTVAGKSKSDYSGRKAQNKGVKDGTIRIGRGGKSYNVWDEKTGRWLRGKVKVSKPKPKSNIKDTKASRVGGYTPGTKSKTAKDTGWWSNNRYPGKYS